MKPTSVSPSRYIPDNISSFTERILSQTVVSTESVSIYSSFQSFISKDRVTLSDTKTLNFSTGVAELTSVSISTISKLQINDSTVIQTIHILSDSVTIDTDLVSFPMSHTPEYQSSLNEGEDIRQTQTLSALQTTLPNDALHSLHTGSDTTLRSRVSSTNSFEYKNSMTNVDSQLLPTATFYSIDDRGIFSSSDFISKISQVISSDLTKDRSDVPLSTISEIDDLSHSFTVMEPVAISLKYSSIPALKSQSDSSLTKVAPSADTRTLLSIGSENVSHTTDRLIAESTSLADLSLSISTNYEDAFSSIESYKSFTINSDNISSTSYGKNYREIDDQSADLTTVSSYKEHFGSRNNLVSISTTSIIASTTAVGHSFRMFLQSTVTTNIDNYHEKSNARSIEPAIEPSLISSYPDNANGTSSSLLPMSVFRGLIDTPRSTVDNQLITSDDISLMTGLINSIKIHSHTPNVYVSDSDVFHSSNMITTTHDNHSPKSTSTISSSLISPESFMVSSYDITSGTI